VKCGYKVGGKGKMPEPLTKEKETTAGFVRTHYTNPYLLLIPSSDVRSALELAKEKIKNEKHLYIFPKAGISALKILNECFPIFREAETMKDEYSTMLKHSSEILSIIEGGLEGNAKKVRAYTELLVSKLPDDDHMKIAIKRRLDGSYKNDPILEGKLIRGDKLNQDMIL
jgi:hypothetical protein